MLGGYGPATSEPALGEQRFSPYDPAAAGLSAAAPPGPEACGGMGSPMGCGGVGLPPQGGLNGLPQGGGCNGPQTYNPMQQQQQQGIGYNTAQAGEKGMPQQGAMGEVCQFFQKTGWCKYGNTCRFAHAGSPEREICQFFSKAGWCKFGDTCRHLHVTPQGGPPPMAGPGAGKGGPPVCEFFQKAGWCKYGDTCRYVHSQGGPMGGKGAPMGGKGPPPDYGFKGGKGWKGEGWKGEGWKGDGWKGGGFKGGKPSGPPPGQTEVCQFFGRTGWCKYGEQCRFLHIHGETQGQGPGDGWAQGAAAGAAPQNGGGYQYGTLGPPPSGGELPPGGAQQWAAQAPGANGQAFAPEQQQTGMLEAPGGPAPVAASNLSRALDEFEKAASMASATPAPAQPVGVQLLV